MKLLAVDPADRYQTGEELGRRLGGHGFVALPLLGERETGRCPHCGSQREDGLPFCPLCARDLLDIDRPGRWLVSVGAVGRPRPRRYEPRPRPPDPIGRQRPAGLLGELAYVRRTAPGVVNRRLDRLLPPTFGVRWLDESKPFVALGLASEPLARWVAAELRKEGVAASAQPAPLSGAFLTASFMFSIMTVLLHLFAVGWLGLSREGKINLQSEILLVTGMCLVLAAVTTMRQLARRSWASMAPLVVSEDVSGGVLGAASLQRRLRSRRCRAIGRDLILGAHRLQMNGEERTRLLNVGFELLGKLDEAIMALQAREERGTADDLSRRKDEVVSGTAVLLDVVAFLRHRHELMIREAVRAFDETTSESGPRLNNLLDRLEAVAGSVDDVSV